MHQSVQNGYSFISRNLLCINSCVVWVWFVLAHCTFECYSSWPFLHVHMSQDISHEIGQTAQYGRVGNQREAGGQILTLFDTDVKRMVAPSSSLGEL